MKITAEVKKMTSKLGKTYYVLYVEELDKNIYLSNTEAKLLSLLHPTINEQQFQVVKLI